MRSIAVPLELTVRLVSVVEGDENNVTSVFVLSFGWRMTLLHFLDLLATDF
jgi:hypothetical protein